MKNNERKAYYKQKLLEKKIGYMTHEDREKMNELLDTIDKCETQEEKNVYIITLNKFIDERYEQHINESILCNYCAICDECMRRKGVKSCSRFIEKEEE